MIETGHAAQISTEEALNIYDQGTLDGFVPEMAYMEHPEVLCLCKSEQCAVLGVYRAMGEASNKLPHASAYTLSYDKDACIKCGACIERCPMETVSFGDDGYVELGPICVGCGQCVLTCPAQARILKVKDQIPALPSDYLDLCAEQGIDRMTTVGIHDFVGSEIPQDVVDQTMDAKAVYDDVNFLVDQKPSGGAESYDDGTYTAQVVSIGGPMTVEVEIAGGKIKHAAATDGNDTPSIGGVAMRVLGDKVVEANGLDVDVYTMATHSSIAFLRGVEDCLRQAGWSGNE